MQTTILMLLFYFSESTLLELSSRITRDKFDLYSHSKARQAFVKTIHDHKNTILCVPQEEITDSVDIIDNEFLEVAVKCKAGLSHHWRQKTPAPT